MIVCKVGKPRKRTKFFTMGRNGVGPGYYLELPTGPRNYLRFGNFTRTEARELVRRFNFAYAHTVKKPRDKRGLEP